MAGSNSSAADITLTTAGGSFNVESVNEAAKKLSEAMSSSNSSSSTTAGAVADDDVYGIPTCPGCDERDAVQLSTGEWVCQASQCGLFETHD